MNAQLPVAAPSKPTAGGGAIRLINRVDVLQQLLAAVAAVPEGVKLSIPQLRDALVSQADVLAGLQTLVLAGELDPTTLRPSAVDRDASAAHQPSPHRDSESSPSPSPPTGAALAAELDALIASHGLSKSAVAVHVGNGATGWIEALRRSNPRSKSIERIRAFLADPPLEKLQRKRRAPTVAPPAAPVAPVTPLKPPVTKIPIGRHARSYCQQPKACVAGPKGPCRICHANKAAAPALARSSTRTATRRDPTQKPETPLMDVAERQRLNGQRHHARVRRAQEREATALLDQGVDPSKVKSTFQANTMRQVQDRRDREARDADPVEQAKLALQRKGLVVYSASVSGGRKDRFIVSGQQNQLSPAELLDLAERKTGQSFRRVA